MAAADARPPYLDDDLLTQIETTAPSTRWKVDKLLILCAELNDGYASNNAYACAALIRAVLDHIPPVFGHRDFKQVAAQHTFTVQRTDKAHAQKLAGFKDIADDALHRPISANIPPHHHERHPRARPPARRTPRTGHHHAQGTRCHHMNLRPAHEARFALLPSNLGAALACAA